MNTKPVDHILKRVQKDYIGPTKVGINFIYIIK